MRAERGEMSLVGLIVAMTLFSLVLGATLAVFETSDKVTRSSMVRLDMQDRARVGIDAVAKQLRNLASPTPDQPEAIDRALPRDLIFQTVDPVGPNAGANASNVKRIRYCLDNAGKLWRQQQRWTGASVPAVPTATPCPGAGWAAGDEVMADSIVNAASGEPVFTYNSTTTSGISSIHVALRVNLDGRPRPAELSTTVFLRNQNRRPTAAFTATPGAGEIVLNGSTSSDPEGDPLTYTWKDNGTVIGTGIVFKYAVGTASSHSITLTVRDPALLESTAGPTTVNT
jgi:type II secretory pathway component PulJ